MKYVKAFIAGLAFPATVFPILYSGVYLGGQGEVRTVPVQFFPLFIPLVFGLWNDLYFLIGKRCPVRDRNVRLWAHGGILGFLAAVFGVFVIGIPALLFNVTGGIQYLPLVVVPIVYGLIWRYVVKYLNDLVGLDDW